MIRYIIVPADLCRGSLVGARPDGQIPVESDRTLSFVQVAADARAALTAEGDDMYAVDVDGTAVAALAAADARAAGIAVCVGADHTAVEVDRTAVAAVAAADAGGLITGDRGDIGIVGDRDRIAVAAPAVLVAAADARAALAAVRHDRCVFAD